MKKILVTGAFGQLGSEIKELSVNYPGFQMIFTDYDTLDITDSAQVSLFFDREHPDFVINCAAYTAVDKAEQEEEKAFSINAIAPGILAGNCNRFNARLIQISTDYVFDGTNFKPYTEEDTTAPIGVYGNTKREGEIICLNNCSQSIVIRTAWLYSAVGNNFVKTMLRLGQERSNLNVVFDQIGSPTYARDLADIILKIIDSAAQDTSNWHQGLYHFSNEGVCSWYDFALAIHELAGISCKIDPVESKDFFTLAKRPHYSVLNKTKIKSTFNIEIPYWKNSLSDCIRIIQKNMTI